MLAGKEYHPKLASWDTSLLDYEAVYSTAPTMSKEARLRYGESLMTHAMVFTGYHKVEGEKDVAKWRVENRWVQGRDGIAWVIVIHRVPSVLQLGLGPWRLWLLPHDQRLVH